MRRETGRTSVIARGLGRLTLVLTFHLRRQAPAADELTPPSFAAYLDVAVHEGMRPASSTRCAGTQIDFQAGTILVDRAVEREGRAKFTPPKHGVVRTIALTDPAASGC